MKTSPPPTSVNDHARELSETVSTWSSRAASYNSVLQNCRQPYPGQGYLAACTRIWRHKYVSANARLLRAVRSPPRHARACMRALGQARSIALQVRGALARAFRAYSASLDNPNYGGPPVAPLLERADETTKRETQLAEGLIHTLRQSCAEP
jgi:hypothetical protein